MMKIGYVERNINRCGQNGSQIIKKGIATERVRQAKNSPKQGSRKKKKTCYKKKGE